MTAFWQTVAELAEMAAGVEFTNGKRPRYCKGSPGLENSQRRFSRGGLHLSHFQEALSIRTDFRHGCLPHAWDGFNLSFTHKQKALGFINSKRHEGLDGAISKWTTALRTPQPC